MRDASVSRISVNTVICTYTIKCSLSGIRLSIYVRRTWGYAQINVTDEHEPNDEDTRNAERTRNLQSLFLDADTSLLPIIV